MLIDTHVHCVDLEDIDKYADNPNFIITCVSDDLDTSIETTRISGRYRNIVPCIGIHPWVIHEYELTNVHHIEKLISENNVNCLGEVGLDKKFKAHTYVKQLEFFNYFMKLSKEYGLTMNIHAADAWLDVYELLVKNDIDKAYFHWYTGPLELLKKIQESGYYIGLNPAWVIQRKHRVVLEHAEIEHVLTESDAPYNYRGLVLKPELIEKTILYLAEIRGLGVDVITQQLLVNFNKLFKR